MPSWYFAHAQDDLKQRMLRMSEGAFTLDAAQLEMSERALMNVSLKMKAPEVLKHEFLKAHYDTTCNDCQFVLDIQINIPEKP